MNIDLVLDIGANVGQTGSALRSAGYRGRIVSFEPQLEPFQKLSERCQRDDTWECRRLALARESGFADMHVSGHNESSSLLAMETLHADMWPMTKPVGVERVKTEPLDAFAEELGIANHQTLLKIDVQGYEAEVLAGAAITLPRVRAAQVELLFAPLYRNQCNYFETMRILEQVGLRFIGIFGVCHDPQTGYLMFGDGLFVRD